MNHLLRPCVVYLLPHSLTCLPVLYPSPSPSSHCLLVICLTCQASSSLGICICSSHCLKCPSFRYPHDSLPLLLQILAQTPFPQGRLSCLHLPPCLLTLLFPFLVLFFSIPRISLWSYVYLISMTYCLSRKIVSSPECRDLGCLFSATSAVPRTMPDM